MNHVLHVFLHVKFSDYCHIILASAVLILVGAWLAV